MIKINTLIRLFPHLEDKSKASRLKIDDESLYYISIREDANNISSLIRHHLLNYNKRIEDMTITDATAGVGGNTLSFAKICKKVNCIEIDKKRAEYLKNNCEVYGYTNIHVYNEDCINIIHDIEQDIIFFDPPWGGKMYKYMVNLKIYISNVSIESICGELMNDKIKSPKMIVIKLPLNYDTKEFINTNKIIHIHKMDKMMIMIIINKDII